MSKTYSLVWSKSKTCMGIGSFPWRTGIFGQCIRFNPNNLVHLRLCQHSQGAQVGSICRMQLRPSGI